MIFMWVPRIRPYIKGALVDVSRYLRRTGGPLKGLITQKKSLVTCLLLKEKSSFFSQYLTVQPNRNDVFTENHALFLKRINF